MSDARVTIGLDASEALAAAKELPGALERNARKDNAGMGPSLQPVRIPGTTQYEWLSDQQIAVRKWRERQQKDEQAATKERQAAEKKAAEGAKGTLESWAKEFGSTIDSQLVSSFSAASLAVKGLGMAADLAQRAMQWVYESWRSSVSYGFTTRERIESAAIGGGLMSSDVSEAAARMNQAMINAVRLRDPASSRAMKQLGYSEEEFRAGKVDPNEALIRLAGKYKEMKGGQDFDLLAKNLGLSNWEDLIPILQSSEGSLKGMQSAGKAFSFLLSGYTGVGMQDQINAMLGKDKEMPLMGKGSQLPQLLQGVTSLQAMGGGDILSAIARGPQDQIVDNTARTADAVEKMANGTASPQPTPAVLK